MPKALLQGVVERLLPGGEAAVRSAHETLLVVNAVPGDILNIRRTEKRRGAHRGVLESVVKASAQRVDAACDVAAACGGCALQYLDVAAHAALKSAWVRDAFGAFFDADSEWITIDESPEFSSRPGTRRRARWHRGEDSAGVFLGFRARASHAVVRTKKCMIVHAQMDVLRFQIERLLPEDVHAVQMVCLHDGMHVIFESKKTDVRAGAECLEPCLAVLKADERVQPWWRGPTTIRALKNPVCMLHDRLSAGEKWVELAVGPDDFIQGQEAGNRQMLRQLQAWAGSARRIVDLFCGIGNLSLPLAAAVHSETGAKASVEVRGADMAATSIRQAQYNARKLGVTAHFEAVNLFADFRVEDYAGADVLILDAPRKGAKAVCRNIGRLLPETIVMVNCDIASGARDAAALHAQGYRLRALRAFDLFPFSGHVEAMSWWGR
ncbi:MAG: methyltransferase domain-containing protein [Mariprofundaceae bacterium]|nr:methyltransferase domain-containing protein [Mariprofundaceae bacterium]